MDVNWRDHHGGHFENVTALVTGGAGFIGSHLVTALAKLGARVRALDDLSGGAEQNLADARRIAPDRVELISGSVTDAEAMAEAARDAELVFHQAALGSVPESIAQPRRYVSVNVGGTLEALEAARAAGARRFLLASSASIYGEPAHLPAEERMPPRAASPYAATKASAEQLVSAYAATGALDGAALRYFNVFGPRQSPHSAYAAVIAAFADALRRNEAPTIFGDGEQTRDFVYVANVVHANLLAARAPRALGGAPINVASGAHVRVRDLADEMARLAGVSVGPGFAPARPGDVRHSSAKIARAREWLGYEALMDRASGLERTMAALSTDGTG